MNRLRLYTRLWMEWSRRNIRWYIAVLLMLATTINYLDRQTLSVAAPTICKELGLTDAQYGQIGFAFLFAYGLTHPFAGRLIDYLGTRAGFALAVTLWSIANMAHFFCRGFWSLFTMRCFLGAGEAGNFPGAAKSISEWFPAKERTVATGIMNLGAGAGAIIAPPLVGLLVWTLGWQWAFVVTGSTGSVWLILWLALYRHPDRHPLLSAEERNLILSGQQEASPSREHPRGVWTDVLRRSELWTIMGARFVSDPVWFFYLFWLPKYLSSERGFDLKQIALFTWVPYLGADFGSLVGGLVSAYFVKRGMSVLNARKLAMCCFAALMPVALPAFWAKSPYVALMFITVATTAHQAWAASLLTLPADLFPKQAVASAYGFTGMCGTLASGLFQLAVGAMVQSFGYRPIFMMVGFMHPIAALILVLFIRSRPKTSFGGFPVQPA